MKGLPLTYSQLRLYSTIAVLVMLVAILVGTLSTVGTGRDGLGGNGEDACALGIPCNVGHFVLFGLLGAALAVRYATSEAARRSPRRTLVMLVLGIWILAGLTEWGQQWVDNHEPKFGDWLIDMAGALAGIVAGSYLARRLLRVGRD